MKVFLLQPDRDFDRGQARPPGEEALTQDLSLEVIFQAMAGGDEFLLDVARTVVPISITDEATVVYRQEVLSDCAAEPEAVRELYALTIAAARAERSVLLGSLRGSPEMTLHGATRVLEVLVEILRRLSALTEEHRGRFRSAGFRRFFAMLAEELDEAYFGVLDAHLERLRFAGGVCIEARLGAGNRATSEVLLRPNAPQGNWAKRLLTRDRSGLGFEIPERDQAGIEALGRLRDTGLVHVADAVAEATDHVRDFFAVLRFELGFHLGCLNLRDRLAALGAPLCTPVLAATPSTRTARALYDPALALASDRHLVPNDLAAPERSLVMITGANHGGKSTFLRGLALAQLMLGCGMFVAAQEFSASLATGIFTHFAREEDEELERGKLDEELDRMSMIVDHLTPGAVLFANEAFSSTNEREGSEIAGQVVRALRARHVDVIYVTHLFTLADRLRREGRADALFLRAERRDDGTRTFRMVEAPPRPTSHARDVYDQIFATA